MSPFGLFASALICAKSSPVAFCVTLTLMPLAFSNPIAMPWHHAVSGELQYIASVPCARAAHEKSRAANPTRILEIKSDTMSETLRGAIPAQAGIHFELEDETWIPALAGEDTSIMD